MKPPLATLLPQALAVALLIHLPLPCAALQKIAAPFVGKEEVDWGSGATIHLSYFNVCTGWTWIWTDWAVGDKFGLIVDAGVPNPQLLHLQMFDSWAHPAYAYTGVIEVYEADENNCPVGAPYASSPILPGNMYNFPFQGESIPQHSAFVVSFKGVVWLPGVTHVATDRPSSGPTGPPACGTCYPTTRQTRSFFWQLDGETFCPGVPFNDGTCNAELLWEVGIQTPVSVEETSWGKIKGLYR